MSTGKAGTRLVVVFFGLIASGKSFLAKAWAEKHRFCYYNTDVVRKRLAGLHPSEPRPEGLGRGLYAPACTRLTYETMLTLAVQALTDPAVAGVALDGSYQSRGERDRVRKAFERRAPVAFVWCSCREEVVKARLARRSADPDAVSDGRWDIYQHQKGTFEYPDELPAGQCLRIDTDEPVELLLDRLDRALLSS